MKEKPALPDRSTSMENPDAAQASLRKVHYEHSPDFPGILRHCGCSLLVSTYQAGKIVSLSEHDGSLALSFHHFEQAMGLAAHPQKLAIGSRQQIWILQGAHDLASRIEPVGTHDACYLARHSLFTGDIHLHELAWGGKSLWGINTLFSCLVGFHEEFSFVPRWKPKFISKLAAEDRCHLNGLAIVDGNPRFVTAMAISDSAGGWRATKSESGVVIDIDSDEIATTGLAMPHSPRWHDGRLWALDSGHGKLVTIDLKSGRRDTVEKLPGYTRGLAFCGQFAFVGLSRIRETAVFGGVPIASENKTLHCGIGVIDLHTGQSVASLQFHSGIEEIFDIQVLPGLRLPSISGPFTGNDNTKTIWLVPPEKQGGEIAPVKVHWLEVDPDIRFPEPSPVMDKPSDTAGDNHGGLIRQGLRFHENGQLAEAIASFQSSLELKPDHADGWNNLGNAFQDSGNRNEALRCYRRAVEVDPDFVHAWRNLGYLLREEGQMEEGLQILRKAQSLEHNDIIQLVISTSLPPIHDSAENLASSRQQLLENVNKLKQDGFENDVTASPAPTLFYAAYQGENDCNLQRDLASLFRTPRFRKPSQQFRSGNRKRVGLISRHFRNHTIGRLNLGLVRELPRDKFDVTVISVGRHDDLFARHFSERRIITWLCP